MSAAPAPKEERRRILVGTASWSDPGFVACWYPKGMPAGERLGWYAEQFEMVEVNSTFYSVPEPRLVERWARSTPNEFIFDVKLHQLLSRHATAAKFLPRALQERAQIDAKGKVLLEEGLESAVVQEFLRAIEPLRAAGKLGALLLQLSPSFSPQKHALAELQPLFAQLADYQVAVEFRNRHWAEPEMLAQVREFLHARGAACVAVDAPAAKHFMIMPPELDVVSTPRLAYLRLHGRDAKAYTTGKTVAARFNYDYNDAEIAQVAERAQKLATEAKEVHVIFNNNAQDYAPHAALRLRAALHQIVRGPARQAELFQ